MTETLWGLIGCIASGLQLGMITLIALKGRLFQTRQEEGLWLLGLYVFGWVFPSVITFWMWWTVFGDAP